MAPAPSGPGEVIYAKKGTLVCRPAGWKDILLFLTLNYFAHAFTIIPGAWETQLVFINRAILTTLLPVIGLAKAIGRIFSRCVMLYHRKPEDGETLFEVEQVKEIRRAHFAEALCTLAVVRRRRRSLEWHVYAPAALGEATEEDTTYFSRGYINTCTVVTMSEIVEDENASKTRSFWRQTIQKAQTLNIHGAPTLPAGPKWIFPGIDTYEYAIRPVSLPRAAYMTHFGRTIKFSVDKPRCTIRPDDQLLANRNDQNEEEKPPGTLPEGEIGKDLPVPSIIVDNFGREQGSPPGNSAGGVSEVASSIEPGALQNMIFERSGIPTLRPRVDISHQRGFLQAMVAIIQILFSVYGLWESRQRELGIYGYAAYSFTVVPYAIMSIVNLLSIISLPQYDALFMVKYNTSDGYSWHGEERTNYAEMLNELMTGAVGSFELPYVYESQDMATDATVNSGDPAAAIGTTTTDNMSMNTSNLRASKAPIASKLPGCLPFMMLAISFVVVGAAPILVIYLFTSFDGKDSKVGQRVFMVLWLVVPTVAFLVYGILRRDYLTRLRQGKRIYVQLPVLRAVWGVVSLLLLALGVGAYYTVISMIQEAGICQVI